VFPNSGLGQQLAQVAQIVAVQGSLGMSRQIFFVGLGGFDNHEDLVNKQQGLLSSLDAALNAFVTTLTMRGTLDRVTLFTESEFNRTGNANANVGTDHAWGSHHIVLGGAVRGGDCYGTYPTLALDGPDDTDTGPNARGRWLPSTSTAQYGATLARWFGVSDADMPIVFPNIGQFAQTDLGFMNNG